MKLRLAPSPAGLLHVESARSALASWLLARRHGGRVLLQLDDADTGRRPEYTDAIEQDLRWLGLDWDESARQSDRLDRYAAAADRLRATGRLYPCFESDEELAAKRDQRIRRGQPAVYDRAMLKMTPRQRAQAEAGGKRPYWRFLLSGTVVGWDDMVLGRQTVKLSAVSDPVVIRADGMPLHGFTSVVDDLDFGITHVVRGADQITNIGVQLDMRAALGGGGMRFGHLPPLTAEDGSKRIGSPSLRSLRTDGVEPAALAGYLARLGTAEDPAAAMPAELAAGFELCQVSRSLPWFDARQLLALNRRALQGLPFEAVRERLPPAATPAFWHAVRGSLDLLREARGWWDVVAGSIVPPLVEGESEFLHAALRALPSEPWDAATWPGWTGALRAATGRKGRALVLPLRLALTGEDDGPELRELLPLMGRSRAAERLRLAAS